MIISADTDALNVKGETLSKFFSKKHEDFVKDAKNIHGERYLYSEEYIKDRIKIEIECKEHGIFVQTPSSHLQGRGCPKCSFDEQRLTKDEFVARSMPVHGNKYNYDLVKYKSSFEKVIIICPRHENFEQIPSEHLRGHGCPRCVSTISKVEMKWLDHLAIPPEYRHQTLKIDTKSYRVDAYDPYNKIIYEFYGDYWHGNPKKYSSNEMNANNKKTFGELYRMTIQREDELRSAGYKIISTWESDWNKK